MAHETPQKNNQYGTAFRSSFWFVVILAGLFVAAVNFVNIMGHNEEEGHEGHGTEATHQTMEATSSQSMHGETGLGTPAEHTTQAEGPASDTTHMEGH